MPNTAKGTPYVQGSDLVSAYPTVSSNLATHIDDNLAYNAVTINAQTGTTYTFVLADASAGKLVTASNAGSQTYTVPPQSSVTWADGAVLRILNQGAGMVTIAAGAGVTINGTPLTLNQYAGAALQRTASNTWTIVPFTGGVGNANFSDAATGTYTSSGINYKYITYTASGTLTVSTAGFADILVVGGGGGGGGAYSGGGGGGGYLAITNAYLAAGTATVVIGAGGAAGAYIAGQSGFQGGTGGHSRLGDYYGVGGGGGAGRQDTAALAAYGNATVGGSGGGGGNSNSSTTGASGLSGQGNTGGNGFNSGGASAGGGGGGAGGTGGNASSSTGGTGGAGVSSSLTNSAVTRAAGGAGSNSAGTAVAGGANTGNGGSGAGNNLSGGAGGSGTIIVRVRTN